MIAYAIVKKNSDKINTYEIYPNDKDAMLNDDEKWVKVEIKVLQKKKLTR